MNKTCGNIYAKSRNELINTLMNELKIGDLLRYKTDKIIIETNHYDYNKNCSSGKMHVIEKGRIVMLAKKPQKISFNQYAIQILYKNKIYLDRYADLLVIPKYIEVV